jgi:hypothetical protein
MEEKKKTYKVIYHIGESINLKTKVLSGHIYVEKDNVVLYSKKEKTSSKLDNISAVSLFMLNGFGSMLKLEQNGRTLWISVVRFCIGEQFALVNAVGTRKLMKEIERYIAS